MRTEERENMSIIHIEPFDHLPPVLLAASRASTYVLLVLPEPGMRQIFTQREDFSRLRARTHPSTIAFVIPEKLGREQARSCGFGLIFQSLDAVCMHAGVVTGKLNTTQELSPVALPQSFHHQKQSLPPQAPPSSALRLLVSVLSLLTVFLGGIYMLRPSISLTTLAAQKPQAQPVITGSVSLSSSRLYNQQGTSGICDEVQVTLTHLPPASPGQSYYAWFLPDVGRSDVMPLLLGTMMVRRGFATLSYQDTQHRDLLATWSQFLLTEQESAITPLLPSLDERAWRVHGMISQQILPSLRLLLTQDPILAHAGMFGGLDFWQYKQSGKLIEWTQSARDYWGEPDPSFLRRQLIRTLDYLDGAQAIKQDVPAGTPFLVDPTIAGIGLLDGTQPHTTSGLLSRLEATLHDLTKHVAPGQKKQVGAMFLAIVQMQNRLQHLRQDAKRLLLLSDTQLRQPQTQLDLDTLADVASDTYTGNGQATGSIWLHQQVAQLAVFSLGPVF